MNSALRPLNTALGAATAAAVCAGLLTVPAQQAAPQIVTREVPVALQALTINDIVTRVGDAITYGFAVAPVWYLGLPISIPMSIGIGFGLADLIPVVGEAFGFTWTLDQVGRTLAGIGLSVLVYAVGPPFMAVSSLLGLTYPSVLPAAARPDSPRSAAAVGKNSLSSPLSLNRIQRGTQASAAIPAASTGRARSARAEKAGRADKTPAAAAASRGVSKRHAR